MVCAVACFGEHTVGGTDRGSAVSLFFIWCANPGNVLIVDCDAWTAAAAGSATGRRATVLFDRHGSQPSLRVDSEMTGCSRQPLLHSFAPACCKLGSMYSNKELGWVLAHIATHVCRQVDVCAPLCCGC